MCEVPEDLHTVDAVGTGTVSSMGSLFADKDTESGEVK